MTDLLHNVLTASFHGSIVILVVAALRLLLKKTPKKFLCLLWMLAFIRLLMPFEIQSSLSLQPEADTVAQLGQPQAIIDTQMFLPSPVLEMEVQESPQPVFGAFQEAPVQEADAPESIPEAAPEPANGSAIPWGTVVAWVWLAVACGFGIYTLVSYLRLRQRVRYAVKIPGGWECDRIETAFILGFIRPKIYIPMGMSPASRRHILAHERTHLEKGDHWLKMAGFVALAVHWFNPLVWLAYVLLCKDIELACDERVVQFMALEERKAYSAALLNCSTNRAHFAACPVAFGEVSVKQRIKTVLNYRRPSFWISLLGVVAIGFVAICLMTSPVEDAEVPEEGNADASQSENHDAPLGENAGGFAAGLSESEIAYVCQQALEALGNQESYHVATTFSQTSTSQHFGEGSSAAHVYKYGDNSMNVYDGEAYAVGNNLLFEGQYYEYYGDAWVVSGSVTYANANRWMQSYSPAGKNVTFPEGTGVLDGNTVAFAAEWTEANPFDREYSGIFTFTFREDGSLASVCREYTYQVSEADGGGEVYYVQTAAVEEVPEDLLQQMQSIAEGAVTSDELELHRIRSQQVSEVPSNKTEYDRDFMLGSSQMGWTFMDGEWFFKFGAEDVTNTGLKLVVEYSGAYGNNTVSGGTVNAGASYFIEELVDGKWVEVPTVRDDFVTVPSVDLASGSTQTINWEENYGALDAGFYRIGNYYTFTANSGETDVKACYAKFRLYDPQMEEMLAQCRNGLAALLASDSYHLMETEWMQMHREDSDSHYYTTEVWKAGKDYLSETLYYRYSDDTLKISRGLMRRDGTYYDLSWTGNSCRNTVSSWNANTYADEDNFQIWSWGFEIFDSWVYDIVREGSSIRITENSGYSEEIPYTETVFTFDAEGKLVGITSAYLYADGTRLVDKEMVVFDSTPAENAAFISGQDLSSIPTFSWTADLTAYPEGSSNVRTKNFVNTTPQRVSGPLDAIEIALRDCTLPAAAGIEPGTNVSVAYYDQEAGMWKVEFTASWDSTIYQAVYLTDRGITQMTVTLELEPEF